MNDHATKPPYPSWRFAGLKRVREPYSVTESLPSAAAFSSRVCVMIPPSIIESPMNRALMFPAPSPVRTVVFASASLRYAASRLYAVRVRVAEPVFSAVIFNRSFC